MTAVEWLVENIREKGLVAVSWNEKVFEQAKEMEKQQIIDAYSVGYRTDFKLNSDNTTQTPEQYYNEKFKMK